MPGVLQGLSAEQHEPLGPIEAGYRAGTSGGAGLASLISSASTKEAAAASVVFES